MNQLITIEEMYRSLQLNTALDNSYLRQTANPYCGSPETLKLILLECPVLNHRRNDLAQNIEGLNHSFLTIKALLETWPLPTSQRKVIYALFDSFHELGVAQTR